MRHQIPKVLLEELKCDADTINNVRAHHTLPHQKRKHTTEMINSNLEQLGILGGKQRKLSKTGVSTIAAPIQKMLDSFLMCTLQRDRPLTCINTEGTK